MGQICSGTVTLSVRKLMCESTINYFDKGVVSSIVKLLLKVNLV